MRLVFCLCFLFLFTTMPSQAQASKQPNIILIIVDDLGWKDLGFMGSKYYETPNLDKLSKESIYFTQAYAAAANCAPSRACLMSGQNTPRHGIYTVSPSARGHKKTRKIIPTKNTKDLADEQITLAEVLQNHTYKTATMGKWHLGPDPKTQGFDLNIGGNRSGHPKSYFSPYKNPNLKDGPAGEYLTDRLTQEAIHFIEENQENPFFLYLPYFTIHTPLQGKKELVEKYKNKAAIEGQGTNPNYSAMVETMDQNVGLILEKLKELELSNTLLIFTSDNGGIAKLSRQYPLRAGKGSYYEGGIRVPLLFYWPERNWKPRRLETPVSNMDLYPTLLDLLNIPIPKNKVLDGWSLKALLDENKALQKRNLYWHFPIYLQAYSRGNDDSRDPLFRTRPGSVIRKGRWKLHEYFEDGGLELYDLKKDPGERHNLSFQKKKKTQKLYQELVGWREQTQAPVPTTPNPDYEEGFVPQKKK